MWWQWWPETSAVDVVRDKFDNRTGLEQFLLPFPRTFQDFDDKEALGMFVPRFWSSIFYMLITAFVLSGARYLFHQYVAIPFGRRFRVPEKRPPVPDTNPALESIFKAARGKPKDKHVQAALEASGKPLKYVQRWFRLRRALNQPTIMDKMSEAMWRFLFYSTSTVYGYLILKDKLWYQDPRYCWIGYPYQDVDLDVRLYYYIEIGFYFSLLFSLSTDTKRKDFTEMVIHHIVTILLMGFSWLNGFYRVGTLILLVHDVADIFLEAGKIANYLHSITDGMFAIFALAFGVSRLYYYPFWALHTVIIYLPGILPPFPFWYVYILLLVTLQVLHVFWFSIIVSMVYKALTVGLVEGDARSDDEVSEILEIEAKEAEADKASKAASNKTEGSSSDKQKHA